MMSPRRQWYGAASKWVALAVSIVISLVLFRAYADDERTLEGTSVVGNRELPRSLYIVPWKTMPPEELQGRPAESVLDEVFQTLDRDVLLRQLRYQDQSPAD